MLEHVPYDVSLAAFAEMSRVANRAVIISLPNAWKHWRLTFVLPKIGERHVLIPKPFLKRPKHQFDGEHYWELNKAGYEFDRVVRDLSAIRSEEHTSELQSLLRISYAVFCLKQKKKKHKKTERTNKKYTK